MYRIGADSYEIYRLGSRTYDTAIIEVKTRRKILAQEDLLPLQDSDEPLLRGTEIGVVGFPGIVKDEFCFFKGDISGYLDKPPTYLVDGVVVSGVSGGPAFDAHGHIVGFVSTYIPNQVNRYTTLPGVSTLVPAAAIRYLLDNIANAVTLKKR